MKTNPSNQSMLCQLSQIYSDHEWINLEDYPSTIDDSANSISLNLQCLQVIKAWIEKTIGLTIEYDFPYRGSLNDDRHISELLNGFCLKVNGSKVIFIPSQNIDITSCEIPQEWVDLPNWFGDYYVPVQVDLEAKYLHLWGMVTHQQLKQSAKLDSLFRYYHVGIDLLVSNMDLLWTSCELAPIPRSEHIPALVVLSDTQAQGLIDRLLLNLSIGIPRLKLSFDKWGTILNSPQYFNQYLENKNAHILEPISIGMKMPKMFTVLSELLKQEVNNLYQQWENVEAFINPSLPKIAFRSANNSVSRLLREKSYRGIPLTTTEEIKEAATRLYRSQKAITEPNSITGVEDLIKLMERSTDETVRWKATEYLWTIDPDHPKLPIRRIRDLGIQFATGSIALMISQLPLDNDRRAILLRVYPVSAEVYLPSGVRLSMLDGNGDEILFGADKPFEAISRSEPQDNYIQLYFVADKCDRFDICVNLGEQKFTEQFIV
jgi:Protein of unknown function (DUF1822)